MKFGRTPSSATTRPYGSLRTYIMLMLVTVTGIILTSSDMSNISLPDMQTTLKNELDIDGSVDVSNPQSPAKTIKQISIIGERNSGTRWTFE